MTDSLGRLEGDTPAGWVSLAACTAELAIHQQQAATLEPRERRGYPLRRRGLEVATRSGMPLRLRDGLGRHVDVVEAPGVDGQLTRTGESHRLDLDQLLHLRGVDQGAHGLDEDRGPVGLVPIEP